MIMMTSKLQQSVDGGSASEITGSVGRGPEAMAMEVVTLQQALTVMLGGYGGAPSANVRERLRASEWLNSFRKKDDAWGTCLIVLGANRGRGTGLVSLEEQVFASQALVFKCRRRRLPITGEDVEALCRLALNFTQTQLRPVLTQLCLGICACSIRHTGWHASKILPDLLQFCHEAAEAGTPDSLGPRMLALELLTVMPEEADSRCGITATPERRREFLEGLRGAGSVLALAVLSQLLEPGSLPQECRRALLRCALNWVQLGGVEWDQLCASPIPTKALGWLLDDQTTDEAGELLALCVETYPHPQAAKVMLPMVMSLQPALASTEEGVCRSLAGVFASTSCAYLPCINHSDLAPHWEPLLEVMVGIMGHPSLEVASLGLDFWAKLGALLVLAGSSSGLRSHSLEAALRHATVVVILRTRYSGDSPWVQGGGGEAPGDSGQGQPGGGGMEEDDGDREALESFREQVRELLRTIVVLDPHQEDNTTASSRGVSGKEKRRGAGRQGDRRDEITGRGITKGGGSGGGGGAGAWPGLGP
ncbi:unnamed protein product, partial [Discosporangium mesarthrocarpum]